MCAERLLFIWATALLALTATVAVANDRYAIAEDQMQSFSPCNSPRVWSVGRPPSICDAEICINPPSGPEIISRRLEGEVCGTEASHCIEYSYPLLDFLGITTERSPTIHYTEPFPSVFEPSIWGRFLATPRSASIISRRSRLVPMARATVISNMGVVEAEVAARTDRAFINLSVSDGRTARALCEVTDSESAVMVPRNCVVTQVESDGQTFVLAPVEQFSDRGAVCVASAILPRSVNFMLEGERSVNLFANHLVAEFHGTGLRLDLDTLEVVVSDDRMILLGAAGPRLSVIDPRLREKIDIVLTGRLASISQHRSDLDDLHRSSVIFTGTIAAWVGRQNVDPIGEWIWPNTQYYGQVFDVIGDSLRRAFERSCNEMQQGESIEVGVISRSTAWQCGSR